MDVLLGRSVIMVEVLGAYLWVRLPVGPSPCGSDSLWVPVPQGPNSDLVGMGPTGNRTDRESDPRGLGPTGIANLRSDLAGLGHTGTRTHRVYPFYTPGYTHFSFAYFVNRTF
jgi:hypothetical protein